MTGESRLREGGGYRTTTRVDEAKNGEQRGGTTLTG